MQYKRNGTFLPNNATTLRSQMLPLMGRHFEWDFAGVSKDDEPFSGQTRWMISRKHDAELSQDQIGLWVPAEDIVFEE